MAKRRMITAKRVIFWGPLGILLLLYFFGQNLGFFPGGQPQTSIDSSPSDDSSEVDVSTVKVMAPESKPSLSSGKGDRQNNDDETAIDDTKDEKERIDAPIPRVLHVLIDDREYFVAAGRSSDDKSQNWQPIGISEIVKRSQETTPSDGGLRVVISRRGSSRVSAEMELVEALHRAGLSDDEIHLEEKLVP